MINVIGFYKFKKISNLKKLQNSIRNYLAEKLINGTVIIAPEGINGTIAGKKENIEECINYIKKKFEYGFGQHSGVIDVNKNIYELPRFPINEKYGDLKRFAFLIDLLPLQYKSIIPKDKYVVNNNPPKLVIEFFNNQKNLKKINCFSDEGNKWEKSNIKIIDNKLIVNFRENFLFRRGRINCSLNDNEGWRWFGLQFSVKLN